MATYVLQNSAQQIDQAVGAAYSGLIVAGTGIVRLTGAQEISGVKTFADFAYFESGANLSGLSSIEKVDLTNSVYSISPTGDSTVDLGSQSKRFKTGWFNTITGNSGIIGGDFTVLGTLNATIVPAISLNNAQGNNLTLSGTTNLNNANFSGNATVANVLTTSGNFNVSGNSIFNGTITATGNKTFSGTFSQSGSSTFSGNINHNGSLTSTGIWNHTGVFNQSGDVYSNGTLRHTGLAFFNNSYTGFIVSGAGLGQSVTIYSPVNIVGDVEISGQSLSIKNNLVHSGNSTFNGNCSIVNASLNLSGNSSSPSLLFNKSLTTTPVVGAIEYDKAFFATNELTGAANRSLINQTFNYIAPQNFYEGTPTAHTNIPLLGNTGIYLNTGRYHIKYDIRFGKPGTTDRTIALGITGDHMTNRIGTLTSNITGSVAVNRTGFFASTATAGIIASGANIDGNGDIVFNNFYSFDATVTITGATKIRPIFRLGAAEIITGRAFCMEVTQLATGTGVGLVGANGPWSDS